MEVRFDGKVALVTGSSRGIGRAIAAELAASGARVMLSSRKAEDLETAAAEIDGDVAWTVANAGDPAQAPEGSKALAKVVVKSFTSEPSDNR
jgi:NAD(P)-dependent dehydrogenase (short-subunit alcohol dehydrogenase family)